MYSLLVAFTFSTLVVSCFSSTPVQDCENGIPLPAITQINDCEQFPCLFEQGTNAIMNVTFRSGVYTEALTPEVIATALGVDVNYPLNEKNGCNSLINLRCPIEENEVVVYQLVMPIQQYYPTVSLTLKFTLYDERNEGLICFITQARVTSSSN